MKIEITRNEMKIRESNSDLLRQTAPVKLNVS